MLASRTALTAQGAPLSEFRVLVIEDDYFLAAELVSVLQENGASVLGPASNLQDGRRLAVEQAPDCVLLDVNLHGEPSFALADEFKARGIPMIFTTGYDSTDLPDHLQDTACLSKPLDIPRLLEFIRTNFGRKFQ